MLPETSSTDIAIPDSTWRPLWRYVHITEVVVLAGSLIHIVITYCVTPKLGRAWPGKSGSQRALRALAQIPLLIALSYGLVSAITIVLDTTQQPEPYSRALNEMVDYHMILNNENVALRLYLNNFGIFELPRLLFVAGCNVYVIVRLSTLNDSDHIRDKMCRIVELTICKVL